MKRRLSSIQFAWSATLACTLIAAPHFGCGKVKEGPDLGTPSGGAVGASSSGGTTATSSGGTTAISSGGVVGATGGGLQIPIEEPPPPPLPCDPPFPGLDPPCSEQDLHGEVWHCTGGFRVSFEFPLTSLTPPADNLRLVCLPLDASLGAGGMGGSGGLDSAVPFDLGYLYPSSAGEVESESTFSLTKPAHAIESGTSFDALPTACIETRGEYPDSYLFAEVAVAQGDTVVEQRRLLLDSFVCLK